MPLFLQPHPFFLEGSQSVYSRKHVCRRNMHHEFSNVIMAQCVKKKKKVLRIFEKITWLEMEGKARKYHFFGFRRKWEAGGMQREPNPFKEKHYVLRKEIQWYATHLHWHSDEEIRLVITFKQQFSETLNTIKPLVGFSTAIAASTCNLTVPILDKWKSKREVMGCPWTNAVF